jgi:hypothetical protein
MIYKYRYRFSLGSNREACIILNKERNSRYFKLETGRPQGDNLSPFTFNFCEQIVIYKLELDPGILRIARPAPRIITTHVLFQAEANRETSTNESLADDSTVLSLIDDRSLTNIKSILDDFAACSGLECNYDKTALMPMNEPNDDERIIINNSGFNPLMGGSLERRYRVASGSTRPA